MWNPEDAGEWWHQRGSFLEPVTPPSTDICAGPLYSITVNQEWLPFLAGAAMQLAQPSTWKTATEADRHLAIARATDLIAEIGTAVPCNSSPAILAGVTTSQTACNVAGYLANVVIRGSLQSGIDSINQNLTLLGFGRLIIYLIPESGFLMSFIAGALQGLYQSMTGGTLGDYTDAVGDATLWSKITCAIYTATEVDGGVTDGNFPTILTNISAVTYAHGDVITAIHDYVSSIGVSGLQQLQQTGVLAVYDCSSCGTGVSTGPSGFQPRSAAGTVSITIPAGSGTAGVLVTFAEAFSAVPVITLGCDNPDLIASIASAATGSFLATLTAAVDVLADITADVTWSAVLAGSL